MYYYLVTQSEDYPIAIFNLDYKSHLRQLSLKDNTKYYVKEDKVYKSYLSKVIRVFTGNYDKDSCRSYNVNSSNNRILGSISYCIINNKVTTNVINSNFTWLESDEYPKTNPHKNITNHSEPLNKVNKPPRRSISMYGHSGQLSMFNSNVHSKDTNTTIVDKSEVLSGVTDDDFKNYMMKVYF